MQQVQAVINVFSVLKRLKWIACVLIGTPLTLVCKATRRSCPGTARDRPEPSWHRRLRLSRSRARAFLKSFVAKPRVKKATRALRLVDTLERHHSRPCYDSVRRAIRGLGMSTWNNSWKGNYWGGGGRKKAPKPQQPKRKAEKPHDELPAYDSDRWASSSTLSSSSRPSQSAGQPSVSDLTKLLKSIVETGQLELPEEAKALLAAQAETDAKEDIQQEQRLLNAKRKAHGKILRLKDALERKKEKFQVYKAALKDQLAKETDRFHKDVEGINKAILETESLLVQLEQGNMGEKDQPAETMEIELDTLLDNTEIKERAGLHAKLALAEKEKQEMADKYEVMNSQLIAMQMQYQHLTQSLRAPMGSQAATWNISPVGSEDLAAKGSPQMPRAERPIGPFTRSSTPRPRSGPYTETKTSCATEARTRNPLEEDGMD